jgi:hypothetical protein
MMECYVFPFVLWFGNRQIDAEATKCALKFQPSSRRASPRFQGLAHPFKYLRTVSSTLVTAIRVTDPRSGYKLLPVVVVASVNTTCRDSLQVRNLCNPEKSHKTQQNRVIDGKRPALPFEICSAHQNTLERVGKR